MNRLQFFFSLKERCTSNVSFNCLRSFVYVGARGNAISNNSLYSCLMKWELSRAFYHENPVIMAVYPAVIKIEGSCYCLE